MQLSEGPAHGYAIYQKLLELGICESGTGPAPIYRTLSRLEEEGLAVHEHSDGGQGPTRKVYSLTGEGMRALEGWRSHVEETRRFLDWFLKKAPKR